MWALPAAIFIGLALGALGGGGSILAVPALVYVGGMDPVSATATSLVVVGVSSLSGSVPHWRAGRVRVGTAAVFVLTGVAGAWLGTKLNAGLDPDVLLLAFSGLVLFAAWRMLTRCPSCTKVGEDAAVATPPHSTDRRRPSTGGALALRERIDVGHVVRFVAAGSAVGFLTGLFGVGGGFMIVPALTLVLGFGMPVAVGTSLLVIAGNAGFALAFRGVGAVDWSITAPFAVLTIIGTVAGAQLAGRLDPERSLRAFALLLVCVALFMGTTSVMGLVAS
jgi:uncharacterized membrane protein YfcA